MSPTNGLIVPASNPLPPGELRVLGLFERIAGITPVTWPDRLVVRAYFAEITIDLRYAELPPVSSIDLSAWFAEVTIVVPPGVHVEFDCYTMIADAIDETRRAPASAADAPRVQIIGSAHVADVRVKVKPR